MIKEKITPLERQAQQYIENIDDVLLYPVTSLFIYFWKNDKSLIEWISKVPTYVLDEVVDESIEDLDKFILEDLCLLSTYMRCIDRGNWESKISQHQIKESIEKIKILFTCESINRKCLGVNKITLHLANGIRTYKNHNPLDPVMEITLKDVKKPYSTSSYSFRAKQSLELVPDDHTE